MNKVTYKVLLFINSGKGTKSYNVVMSKFKKQLIPSIDDSIHMLITDRMIGINYAGVNEMGCLINPSSITITAKGKEFIENQSSQKFRFWLPIIISIAALIGAYRKELLLLAQILLQLLKSIMGN